MTPRENYEANWKFWLEHVDGHVDKEELANVLIHYDYLLETVTNLTNILTQELFPYATPYGVEDLLEKARNIADKNRYCPICSYKDNPLENL